MHRQRPGALAVILLFLTLGGCADIRLRPHRNDELVGQYRYALGEQYIEVDGLRLCYQEYGQGPPVVILPGLGTSIDFWQLNIPALAEHHRVLAVDLPGWGKSDKPDVRYELRWICDTVVRFMDAVGIPRASLIGGSMGGHVALLVALNHPERVDRLVLMGAVGNWNPPGPLARLGLATLWSEPLIGEFLRLRWPDLFEKMFHCSTPMTESLFRYQMAVRANSCWWEPEARASIRGLRSIIMTSCRSDLPRLTKPVLLVWGEEDSIHAPEHGMDFRRLLPCSRLVVIPCAAHEVMADQPCVFNDLVLTFLEEGLQAIPDSYPPELEGARRRRDNGSPGTGAKPARPDQRGRQEWVPRVHRVTR